MKKTITLLMSAILCLSIAAKAQINKGSTLFGGTLSLYSNNLKNPDTSLFKQTIFHISPSIGFATAANTVLGFELLYETNTAKGYASFETKSNTYGAGIFLRKYKLLMKNFYLFGEGNLLFTYADYNYSANNAYLEKYNSKAYGIGLNLEPGLAYNLTKNLQLEAGLQNLLSLGYTNSKENSENVNVSPNYKENAIALSSSLNTVSLSNIYLGVRFFCNK